MMDVAIFGNVGRPFRRWRVDRRAAWVIGIIFASLTAILGSLIAAAIVTRLLQPVRITETHAFYTGAGAAFLDGLPRWPGA